VRNRERGVGGSEETAVFGNAGRGSFAHAAEAGSGPGHRLSLVQSDPQVQAAYNAGNRDVGVRPNAAAVKPGGDRAVDVIEKSWTGGCEDGRWRAHAIWR